MTSAGSYLIIALVGAILTTAGLIADPLVPRHLEPFAAGFAFAGLIEMLVGLLAYTWTGAR